MDDVKERALERQGRRMGRYGGRLFLLGVLLAIPGLVLVIVGWSIGLGWAILLLASIPGVIGFGLLCSGAVSRWSARHKLFA
jgi:hypothetical protein